MVVNANTQLQPSGETEAPATATRSVILCGRRSSPNVQKVLWALAEFQLKHEVIEVGGRFGRLQEPAYKQLNPNGRVPVLVDGEFAIWESNAILRHLARRFAGHPLAPNDLISSARIDMAHDLVLSSLWPPIRDAMHYLQAKEMGPSLEITTEVQKRTDGVLASVDALLAERPYMAGKVFTIADIPLGVAMSRYVWLGGRFGSYRHLTRWYHDVAPRPAFADTVGME